MPQGGPHMQAREKSAPVIPVSSFAKPFFSLNQKAVPTIWRRAPGARPGCGLFCNVRPFFGYGKAIQLLSPKPLDLVSGEIHASTQTELLNDAIFVRNAILDRLRQAGFASAPGDLNALGYAGPALAYAG